MAGMSCPRHGSLWWLVLKNFSKNSTMFPWQGWRSFNSTKLSKRGVDVCKWGELRREGMSSLWQR